MVSELVRNSVRHGRPLGDGTIVVSWRLEDARVELCVTDGGGETQPRLVRAPPTSPSGRGIAILDVLADEWWCERTPTRSTVHARLSV